MGAIGTHISGVVVIVDKFRITDPNFLFIFNSDYGSISAKYR